MKSAASLPNVSESLKLAARRKAAANTALHNAVAALAQAQEEFDEASAEFAEAKRSAAGEK